MGGPKWKLQPACPPSIGYGAWRNIRSTFIDFVVFQEVRRVYSPEASVNYVYVSLLHFKLYLLLFTFVNSKVFAIKDFPHPISQH